MHELFADELKKLRGRFVEMGINTSEQLYQAIKAFSDKDTKLAQKVIDGDQKINEEEVNLEKLAFNIMALQQPFASDFRMIMSILKASSDLERMGDYAAHIAREAIKLADKDDPDLDVIDDINKMTAQVRVMLEKVLDSYARTDEKVAYEVANEDLSVDMEYVKLRKRIIKWMTGNPEKIRDGERYLSVVKVLERFGDHAVNLAEWVIYSSTGKIVELNPGKTDPDIVGRELKQEKENSASKK